MEKYLYIGASLALTVYAQVMMKWRAISHTGQGPGRRIDYLIAMYSDARVLSVFVCAALTSVLWSLAIQRIPLTVAYPFMALSFVLVPLASVMLFRESLSMPQIVGIVLIVLGVALSTLTH
jgi:multidrug transporter EmrE-like cation transporter